MNFAIVGCGLIGQKRLDSLRDEHRLIIAADSIPERAEKVASENIGTAATQNWRTAVSHPDVEAVIVSTTNNWLAPVTGAAIAKGKHVLVEKPAARSCKELEGVITKAENGAVCVKVGFNHRFHPGFQKARRIIDTGQLGPLMFIRGRYGHGGRLGYENEWRAKPEISGGGELLDQGVHLIDLSRWFLGDFADITGTVKTYYWHMPAEDNAFLMLRTPGNQTAWLHVSCTEWKNMFSFEIYGKYGKLQVDGLGGSYGIERLSYYRMLPQMGPPETTIWEYPGEDKSWKMELDAFVRTISEKKSSIDSLYDARAALYIVQKIYEQKIKEEEYSS